MEFINRTAHFHLVEAFNVKRLRSVCVSQSPYTHKELASCHTRPLNWCLTKGVSPPPCHSLRRWVYHYCNWCPGGTTKTMVQQARGLSFQVGCSTSRPLDSEENEAEDIEGWKVEEAVCDATVEFMSSVADESESTATVAKTAWTASGPTSSTFSTASVEVVDTLDPFAKAKILNFTQRMLSPSSSNAQEESAPRGGLHQGWDKSVYGPEVREVQGHSGRGTQYHATLRLPLPVEYGPRCGEGFASTARDAEVVAAMHAERVLDALGFPIYQLSSKQSRHAAAARKAGRWAPMPGEEVMGQPRPLPTTPSPAPLQYVREKVITRVERQLQLDKVHFINVARGVFTPFQYTLASPYFFDWGSVKRIRCFFEAYNANITQFCKVTALHKISNQEKKRHKANASDQIDDDAMEGAHSFLAQLKLPIASRFGERVCMGKGPSKKEAIVLACMHAELTIDALGLSLYPTSREKQVAHAMECKKVQRWCAPVGDCDFRYDVVSPPPLQMLPGHTVAIGQGMSAASTETRVAQHHWVGSCSAVNSLASVVESGGGKQQSENGETASHAMPLCDGFAAGTGPSIAELQNGETSIESVLLQHNHAVNNFSCVQEVGSLNISAKLLLDNYLKHYHQTKRLRNTSVLPRSLPDREELSPYLVECLGIRQRETYRATVTIPLFAFREPCEGENAAVRGNEQKEKECAHNEMCSDGAAFVAIGIARTSHDAEVAAATHALNVLAALNHPIVFSSDSESLFTTFRDAVTREGGQESFPCHDPTKRVKGLHEVVSHSSCFPVRCVGEEHVGRIATGGLSQERQSSSGSMVSGGVVAFRSPLTFSSRASNHNQETKLMNSFLQARQTLPPSDWSLEEDGDGRIVVDPISTREAARNYVHTLPGVRTPDVFAINRLQDYLERHGKPLETSLTHSWQEVDDEGITKGQQSSTQGNPMELHVTVAAAAGKKHPRPLLHIVKVLLPVAQRVGAAVGKGTSSAKGGDCKSSILPERLIAHGEAYSEEDAVLMCAMHAELLLDTLGVPLYDHPALQRKHIDTANMLGRQIGTGEATKAPAPVRKEHPNSRLWARIQYRASKRVTLSSQSLPKQPEGVLKAPGVASPPSQSDVTAQTDTSASTKPPGSLANTSDAPAPSSPEFTDDSLCDLSKLQSVHHTEVFRQALKHIRAYCQHQGCDFFRMLRQYTVRIPRHGTVYRAIAEIPLPERYGKRFAVGCASTKGRALNLCATHAVWTLDALNIPIYVGRNQITYAKSSRLAGRSSPMPGDALMPKDTPSPKGLCDLSVGAVGRPEAPVLPSLEEIEEDPVVWTSYIRACKIYLRKNEEAALNESLFELHQTPRSGVAVEDEGLSVVERMPINNRARHQLVRLCADAGLPRPETFRYNIHGKASEKWYFVETPVLGTVFKARGLAQSAADSLSRTAMHYEYLIRTAVLPQRTPSTLHRGAQGGRLVPTAGERTRQGTGLFDSAKGDFTIQGKAAVLALYAATHRPYQPVQLTLREGAADPTPSPALGEATRESEINSQAGSPVVVVAELNDDLGLCHSAKGKHSSDVSEAVERAVSGLFHLLQRKAAMQSIGQVVKRYPSIRMGALCTLVSGKGAAGVAVLDSATTPLCKAAKKSTDTVPPISEESLLNELKDLPIEGSKDLLSSSHAAVLLDAVAHQLGQSSTHAPPTPPAFMRDNFPALGLLAEPVHVGASSRQSELESSSKGRLTPIAGAVALLMQCIPRQTLGEEGSRGPFPQYGPLLPIQLGKLLLAGFLLDCVPFAVRMAAMVMDLQGTCSIVNSRPRPRSGQEDEEGTQELQWQDWQSVDLVEEVLYFPSPPSSLGVAYEAEIGVRLRELQAGVERYIPSSQLAELLSRSKDFQGAPQQSTHGQQHAAPARPAFLETRLRMCVAFATYPQILTPKVRGLCVLGGKELLPAGAAASPLIVLEPMDGGHEACVKAAASSAGVTFACFDVLLHCNPGAGQAGLASETNAVGQRRGAHTHGCVAGTLVLPLLSIVATVRGCNERHVLEVQEETPNLGMMLDGTVPLAFSPGVAMERVRVLQDVFAQSLSYLKPPPSEALHALDTLLHSIGENDTL